MHRRRFLHYCVAATAGGLAGCADADGPRTDSRTAAPTRHAMTPPAGTDGATPSTTIGPADARATSREIVTRLVAGEYEAVVTGYSYTQQVASQLDAGTLENAWTQQTSALGQFVEITQVAYARSGGYHVVDVVGRFSAGRLITRLAFTETGEIASLTFRQPASDADWSAPAYAERSAFEAVERTVPATDDCALPAELTLPTGEGQVPGVVLVHGSGPSDMDETVGPNKPFKDLAWGLSSRGVGVLRYDKRTFACDVDRSEITLEEKVTDDALAALETLREHPRIDPARTVVVGHSIGAMLTPRIVARNDALAGGIMLAAPARPLSKIVPEQVAYLLRLDGTLTDREQERLASVRETARRVRNGEIGPDEIVFGLGGRPFWAALRAYDQVAVAQRLDRPLAFLQGERDYQVSPAADFGRWQAALDDRPAVTFHSYDALNHLFMPGEGQPSPREYFQPNNVGKAVVTDIADRVHQMTDEGDTGP